MSYSYESGFYLDKLHQENSFCQIIYNAIEYFKGTYKIQNFKELKSKIKSCLQKIKKNRFESANVSDFTKEDLIDAFKITMCFENYMKGLLINESYLAHQIDRKVGNGKFKCLGDINQKPIKISQLKKIEGYVKTKEESYYLRGLKKQTISLSSLLNNNYQEIIRLPIDIKNIISGFKKTRDTHHLIMSEGALYSKDKLENIKKLIEFVNQEMITKYNDSVRKLNPHKCVNGYLIEKIKT